MHATVSHDKVDYSRLRPIIYDSETNTYRTLGHVLIKAFGAGRALK